MSDDVANVPAKVFGGKVNVADMKSLAQRAATAAQTNKIGGGAPNGSDYLNFSGKRGVFTIGKDKRTIPSDENWVVDITSFEEGFVCWKNRKPEASRMSNIYSGVPVQEPDPDERGPFNEAKGEGWYKAMALVLKSKDNGQQGYFKNNSVSGVGEIADLMEAFSERAAQGEPCWPVVRLVPEEFDAQGFTNFKPTFEVIEWLTTEQIEALGNADAEDDDEEEEAPSPRRRARK